MKHLKVALIFIFIFTIVLIGWYGRGTGLTAADNTTQQKQPNYKVTFIELGSVRCIPCKKMVPIMEEIKKEYVNQVQVIFYDVWTDEGKPFGEKYSIRLIPTQIFLDKNGKEYYRHEGFFPKEELVAILKQQGVK